MKNLILFLSASTAILFSFSAYASNGLLGKLQGTHCQVDQFMEWGPDQPAIFRNPRNEGQLYNTVTFCSNNVILVSDSLKSLSDCETLAKSPPEDRSTIVFFDSQAGRQDGIQAHENPSVSQSIQILGFDTTNSVQVTFWNEGGHQYLHGYCSPGK